MKQVFVISVIFLLILLSGCLTESRGLTIAKEFVKHSDLNREEWIKMHSIIKEWNSVESTAAADGVLTPEEGMIMVEIAEKYAKEYKIARNYQNSYREFIAENEQELKNNGVDTFERKKEMDENDALWQNNIETMARVIERGMKIIEGNAYRQREREQLDGVLKLLYGLLGT
ncbi:MAG: hypothetical protein V3T58_00555 [Candidatus Hydrothermarchaeales archaeon]